MDTIQLPQDFREFLKLLNSKRVEYLVIGGYAVGYHGHPRPTGDLDIWISNAPDNAERAREALEEFGFHCHIDILLKDNQLARMGRPPFRIEVMTTIDGVNFSDCYSERVVADVNGVEVSLISLSRLKENKKASGRSKDVTDLENLP
jgi:predicted nucleotidyltransferase